MREMNVFAVSSEGLTDSEMLHGTEGIAVWILKKEMFSSRAEAEQAQKTGTLVVEHRITVHAELVGTV